MNTIFTKVKLLGFTCAAFLIAGLNTAAGQTCTSFLTPTKANDMVLDGKYLWIATQGGLVKMDTATLEKTHLNKSNSSLPQNALRKLRKTKEDFWMSSGTGLLFKHSGGNFSTVDLQSEFGLEEKPSINFMEAVGDTLFISSKDAIFKHTPSGWSTTSLNYQGQRYDSWIQHFAVKGGKIILSISSTDFNNQYIHFVEISSGKQTLLKEFQMTMIGGFQFGDKNIWHEFALDPAGNIWTRIYEGGIAKIDINTKDTTSYRVPNHIRNCPNIYFNFLKIVGSKLYCGGVGKNGLVIFDIVQKTWETINESNSDMSYSDIISQAYINDDTYFLGNEQGVVKTKIKTKECVNISLASSKMQLTFDPNPNIVEDKLYVTGSKYMGDNDSLLIYDFQAKTWSKNPTFGGWAFQPGDIIQDAEGTSWIPTRQGLFYKPKNSNTISQYMFNGIAIDEINDILIDKNGNKWINANLGIYKIDAQGMVTQAIERQYHNGVSMVLANNYIYSGRTVLGKGILRININTLSIDSITSDSYNLDISYISAFAKRGDTLYYADSKSFGRVVNGQAERLFTHSDIVQRLPSSPIPPFNQPISSLDVDSEGLVWIASNYGLYSYNAKSDIFQSYTYANSCLSLVNKVKVDSKNRKLLTSSEGIYIFEDAVLAEEDELQNKETSGNYVYKEEATRQAFLKLADAASIAHVSIVSATGTQLSSTSHVSATMPISGLSEGVYVAVLVYADGKKETVKFIY